MKHRLVVAEELVEEGNSLLKICAEKMHLPTFTEGQQKIEIGLKRKNSLQDDLKTLAKRRKTVKNKVI